MSPKNKSNLIKSRFCKRENCHDFLLEKKKHCTAEEKEENEGGEEKSNPLPLSICGVSFSEAQRLRSCDRCTHPLKPFSANSIFRYMPCSWNERWAFLRLTPQKGRDEGMKG